MVFTPPLPRNEPDLRWFGIDFDLTLCDNSGYPDFTPTDPIWANIYKAINVFHAGYKLVIYTSRHWSDYEMIREWCRHHGLPVSHIVCGKPLFKKIIDDRAVPADAETYL